MLNEAFAVPLIIIHLCANVCLGVCVSYFFFFQFPYTYCVFTNSNYTLVYLFRYVSCHHPHHEFNDSNDFVFSVRKAAIQGGCCVAILQNNINKWAKWVNKRLKNQMRACWLLYLLELGARRSAGIVFCYYLKTFARSQPQSIDKKSPLPFAI